MDTTTSTTASSAYRTDVPVTIDDRGIVRHQNGTLLGDRAGMELLGWEFAA